VVALVDIRTEPYTNSNSKVFSKVTAEVLGVVPAYGTPATALQYQLEMLAMFHIDRAKFARGRRASVSLQPTLWENV
jgi:hypothetical protein